MRMLFSAPYDLNLYTSFRPGSSVGIATDYGLDGPGIDSFPYRSDSVSKLYLEVICTNML
jgi:hypothetical protein